jgi:hypothetical protein
MTFASKQAERWAVTTGTAGTEAVPGSNAGGSPRGSELPDRAAFHGPARYASGGVDPALGGASNPGQSAPSTVGAPATPPVRPSGPGKDEHDDLDALLAKIDELLAAARRRASEFPLDSLTVPPPIGLQELTLT